MLQKSNNEFLGCILIPRLFSFGLTLNFSIFSLGLRHDGDPQTLNCNADMKYIMAPSFAELANPHMWSECSQQQLTDFLR